MDRLLQEGLVLCVRVSASFLLYHPPVALLNFLAAQTEYCSQTVRRKQSDSVVLVSLSIESSYQMPTVSSFSAAGNRHYVLNGGLTSIRYGAKLHRYLDCLADY